MPRYRIHFLRVLVFLSLMYAGSGCTLPQTFYSLDRVYAHDAHPQVLIHKGRTWFSFLRPEEDSSNYIASVNLGSDAESGNSQLANAIHLADDGSDEQSTFTFVNGTSKVIQLQDHRNTLFVAWNTTADVFDLKSRSRSRLATVCLKGRDPDRGVFAVTRSGSRLLAVDAKQAVLYDPAQQKPVGHESDLLVELRRLIVEARGNPGNWFLTDDMKYVVISPPGETETEHGTTAGGEPIPITIAGKTIDINESGLIFERATKAISIYPREYREGLMSDPLVDAENVNGDLRFVYSRFTHAELTDSTGKLLATHSISTDSQHENAFAGWDPLRGEIWFQSVRGKLVLDERTPDVQADHFVTCWNAQKNAEKRYRIRGGQIAEALAKAR